VAAPLIQGVERLRCLVQGCCHGRPVPPMLPGIRYTQPRARVCRIAGWRGVPIHATPLYSLLGNLVILGLLIRLWIEGADVAFIAGVYLLLNASARFMEEAFRGEPQTVRFGGLPIYQWLSIGCVLAGMGLSVLPAPAAPAWHGWHAAPLAYALPLGLIVWAAMGVDFPESNARMSRLA
jgi:prolipoprotein diacylglyceryltransferase